MSWKSTSFWTLLCWAVGLLCMGAALPTLLSNLGTEDLLLGLIYSGFFLYFLAFGSELMKLIVEGSFIQQSLDKNDPLFLYVHSDERLKTMTRNIEQNFLYHRAQDCQALAQSYTLLWELLDRLNLYPVSGDVNALKTPDRVGFSGMPTYWPHDATGGDKGCIEIRRTNPSGEFVARIKVTGQYYYGITVFGDGNHDWSIGELGDCLKKTLERLDAGEKTKELV